VHGIDRVHFYCTEDARYEKDCATKAGGDVVIAMADFKQRAIDANPKIYAKEQGTSRGRIE
jgi:hypothetical protein